MGKTTKAKKAMKPKVTKAKKATKKPVVGKTKTVQVVPSGSKKKTAKKKAPTKRIVKKVGARAAGKVIPKRIRAKYPPPGPIKKYLNAIEVQVMSTYFCTVQEIAHAYGMSERQLYRRFAQEPDLREGFVRGRAEGKRLIKSRQFFMAVGNEEKGIPPDGNMLRWLGQNLLGQSSRTTKVADELDHHQMDEALEVEFEEIEESLEARNAKIGIIAGPKPEEPKAEDGSPTGKPIVGDNAGGPG